MGIDDMGAEAIPPRRVWQSPTWLVGHLAADAQRLMLSNMSAAARTDYAVLSGLDEYGSLSQAAIGRRLGIDRSDVSAVVDRLEADGGVTRMVDPTHRSRKIVRLSAKGEQRMEELDAQVRKAQQAFLGPLTEPEAAQLTRLLQLLVQHHRPYRRAT